MIICNSLSIVSRHFPKCIQLPPTPKNPSVAVCATGSRRGLDDIADCGSGLCGSESGRVHSLCRLLCVMYFLCF